MPEREGQGAEGEESAERLLCQPWRSSCTLQGWKEVIAGPALERYDEQGTPVAAQSGLEEEMTADWLSQT